jgi:hypothetical protein
MKLISRILKLVIIEILILFVYIVFINGFFGNVDEKIKADGIGYYDYLPSIFIHHDLVRKDIPFEKDPGLYARILDLGVYVDYGEFKVDKYPCGTAILEFPFFMYTLLTAELEGSSMDGYQRPFHTSIFHAAIFYLFLSLLFLKGTLRIYGIRKYIIHLSQLLLVLSTPVTNYAHFDAGFSHIYSLFAITAFLFFVKSYFSHKKLNHFLFGCLILGLIITLRQVNILIILFIPFLAGSIKNLKDGFGYLIIRPVYLFAGIAIVFGVFFIQGLLWYLQVGKFLIISYQGEGFNFLDPHFFSILFGYRKGLFVYTPVLFIALLSMVWLAFKREYFLMLSWGSFFILLTYVLSSWWSWSYGDSYGLRAYIDFYTLFLIPFALMLNGLQPLAKVIFMAVSLLTIPVNIIQTYQYKHFILHWNSMDKDRYWKVFLRTDPRYEGLFFKIRYNYSQFQKINEISVGDFSMFPGAAIKTYTVNTCLVQDFQKVSIIQILIDNNYHRDNDLVVLVTIKDPLTKQDYHYHHRYLLHFLEEGFNKWQTGLYNFEFTPIPDKKELIVSLEMIPGKTTTELKNVRIRFLKPVYSKSCPPEYP